jgi:uncharacterized protein (DUF3820 family)
MAKKKEKKYNENTRLDFGKYFGWRILDIDRGYLEWFMQTSTYFNKPVGLRAAIADRVLNTTDNKYCLTDSEEAFDLIDEKYDNGLYILFLVTNGELYYNVIPEQDITQRNPLQLTTEGVDIEFYREVNLEMIKTYL